MTVAIYTRAKGSSTPEAARVGQGLEPGSRFVLRWHDKGGKRHWEGVAAKTYREAEIAALEKQLALLQPAAIAPEAKRLDQGIDDFLATVGQNLNDKKRETAQVYYRGILADFYKFVGNIAVAAVDNNILRNYHDNLKNTVKASTQRNKLAVVTTMLRFNGNTNAIIHVTVTPNPVKVYTPEQLKALFAAANEEERILFEFFLVSGCREKEVSNACWSWLEDGVFVVQEQDSFAPKSRRPRAIPLPDFMVEKLRLRKLQSKSQLIFPSPHGGPQQTMLRTLKRLARRAGLPGVFGLHTFRRTYATLQHRDKVEIATISQRLGHADIKTTMLYVAAEDARSERSRRQVNSAFSSFAA